jgi:acetyl-CoA acetyltransferase
MTDVAPTIAGKTAIVGIGETTYYKRGGSPVAEFTLAVRAIRAAAEDAGLDVRDLDGIASYAGDRNDAVRLAAALGLRELKLANMVWGGGGGGGSAAIANAAAAVAAGYADHVVVFRSLAQGQFGRFGAAPEAATLSGPAAYTYPYGMGAPAHWVGLRVRRFLHEHGAGESAMRAIALACYHHAQRNPRAVMYGKPLTPEGYDSSRWICEPLRLYDCCLENDGAAAVIVTGAERARDLKQKPAYLLAAAQGSDFRAGASAENAPDYASANFKSVAKRLWERAGIAPKDVDVAQIYENFTGAVMVSLVEHGFCTPEEVDRFCTFENLAWPSAPMPINTSGGNMAECYMHGLGLVNEAVRQIRGDSTCQVENVELSMVASGPMTSPVSSLVLNA